MSAPTNNKRNQPYANPAPSSPPLIITRSPFSNFPNPTSPVKGGPYYARKADAGWRGPPKEQKWQAELAPLSIPAGALILSNNGRYVVDKYPPRSAVRSGMNAGHRPAQGNIGHGARQPHPPPAVAKVHQGRELEELEMWCPGCGEFHPPEWEDSNPPSMAPGDPRLMPRPESPVYYDPHPTNGWHGQEEEKELREFVFDMFGRESRKAFEGKRKGRNEI